MQKLIQPLTTLEWPYHEHDCDDCRWYGSFVELNMDRRNSPLDARVVDVYVHYNRAGRDNDSIILRFGSEGSAYESMPRRVVQLCVDHELLKERRYWTGWAVALELVTTKKTHRWYAWEAPDDGLDTLFRIDATCHIDLSDEHGGRYVLLHAVSWPSATLGSLDANDQVEQLRHAFPAIHCQHAHDCCGHYYPSSPKITRLPSGRYLVSQAWNQNV